MRTQDKIIKLDVETFYEIQCEAGIYFGELVW